MSSPNNSENSSHEYNTANSIINGNNNSENSIHLNNPDNTTNLIQSGNNLSVPLLTRQQSISLFSLLRSNPNAEVDGDETVVTLLHSTNQDHVPDGVRAFNTRLAVANVVTSTILQTSATTYSIFIGIHRYTPVRRFFLWSFVLVDMLSVTLCVAAVALFLMNPIPSHGSLQRIGWASTFNVASVLLLALAFLLAWLTVLPDIASST